jgi:hypothetical protein
MTKSVRFSISNPIFQSLDKSESNQLVPSALAGKSGRLVFSSLFARSSVCSESDLHRLSHDLRFSGKITASTQVSFSGLLSESAPYSVSSMLSRSSGCSLSFRFQISIVATGSQLLKQSAFDSKSIRLPVSTRFKESHDMGDRSLVLPKSNPISLSPKSLISSSFEKSHWNDVSDSGSTSAPCSKSMMALARSAEVVASWLQDSNPKQTSMAFHLSGTNLISLLILVSRQMTISQHITVSVTLDSTNLHRTINLGRSNVELRSRNVVFSEEHRPTVRLLDSVRGASQSLNLSRCLPYTIDLILSKSFKYSETLEYSMGNTASHAFGTADLANSMSFWLPPPYDQPAAAQGSGTVWAVTGSLLLLLLLLCALVLFLLWRRKHSELPDDSNMSGEIELGTEDMTVELGYDHDYWNPLMSDASCLDDTDVGGSGGGDWDQEYNSGDDFDASGAFASGDNPLINDEFNGVLEDDAPGPDNSGDHQVDGSGGDPGEGSDGADSLYDGELDGYDDPYSEYGFSLTE